MVLYDMNLTDEIQRTNDAGKKMLRRYPRPQMWQLMTLRETGPAEKPLGDNPGAIEQYWRDSIATDPRFSGDVETFYSVFLNTRRRIIGHALVSTGTLDTLLVHPRNVFRAAIVANAAAVVLMHNHPSGDPTPSEADIRTTRDLVRAGQVLKIDVLDHVIVGVRSDSSKGWCSLRELGHFYTA